MALELYWGSGSPYSWRVMLALEYKRLKYEPHLLEFSKQEHKSPHFLKLNFRGEVPVLKDGDYVIFESLAILHYLDRKYPDPPIFGRSPEEAGTIIRVIEEYQSHVEPHLKRITNAVFFSGLQGRTEEITREVHTVAGEARTIEMRLSKSDWVVGESMSAADMVIYPGIQLLLRALNRPEAGELRSRFLPMDHNYPALARWMSRVEAMPGYERTYPPHWSSSAPKGS
jgi:glutathione S-transferase